MVVILSTITVKGLTKEWFMLWLLYYISLLFKVWQRSYSYCCWLYCLPLMLKVLQRSGSCCCCYFVYHYCLRFERGVVHVLVGYIVYHYCLRFNIGVVHVIAIILSTITVLGLTEEKFMLLLLYCLPLLFKVW